MATPSNDTGATSTNSTEPITDPVIATINEITTTIVDALITNMTDTNESPEKTSATETEMLAMEMDPMDFPAALIYIGLNLINFVVPLAIFYGVIYPVIEVYPGKNTMWQVSNYMLWIGNVVLYAVPALVGGFTWLWNAYVVGGYIAWTQYVVVWGGTIMQFINFIFLIIGAATFEDQWEYDDKPYFTMTGAWIQFVVWLLIEGGIYAGYWLLNDNFLSYYVIEELIHKLKSQGETDPDQFELEWLDDLFQ
jgi:hypothetical protein